MASRWTLTTAFAACAWPALVPACSRADASGAAPVAVSSATVQVATIAAPETDAGSRACPEGMVLVEGEYCPDAVHECLEWLDPKESRYHHFRCKAYRRPATCRSERVPMRFCIDVTERREDGSDLPRNHMSFTSSRKLCASAGARLCREREWQFACEGEEMRPYPYGWERDATACNVDRTENIGRVGRLVDHRAPAGGSPRCASPFGVMDMAGNLEEWTQADGPGEGSKLGWKDVLKGSWWIPSRHACRQFQVGHDDLYAGTETGARCCKDAD